MPRSKVFWPLVVGILVGAAVVLAAVTIQIRTYSTPGRTSTLPAGDAFAREWLEAWNSHDIDRILTFYTEDAFYEDVPTEEIGWGGPSRGHQMIRETLAQVFEEMTDLGFEFVSASDSGDRMVVEWIMTGTNYREYTGKFSIRGVSLIKLKEDRIASVSDYYDVYLLLSQLGMVPTLGATKAR